MTKPQSKVDDKTITIRNSFLGTIHITSNPREVSIIGIHLRQWSTIGIRDISIMSIETILTIGNTTGTVYSPAMSIMIMVLSGEMLLQADGHRHIPRGVLLEYWRTNNVTATITITSIIGNVVTLDRGLIQRATVSPLVDDQGRQQFAATITLVHLTDELRLDTASPLT